MYGSASVPFPPLTKAVEFKETTERAPLKLLELKLPKAPLKAKYDELDGPPEKYVGLKVQYQYPECVYT